MIGAAVPRAVAWIASTAVGAVGGDFIGNIQRLGLDEAEEGNPIEGTSMSAKRAKKMGRRSLAEN